MTRAIFFTASTLNGFLADEQDGLDWPFAVPEGDTGAVLAEFLDGVGVLVLGSATYEWMLRHEEMLAHPERWSGYYGDRPTWVFTTRDLPRIPGAGIRFASGAVAAVWPAMRDAAGDRDVWIVGGGDLAGQFADAGLLDEIRVSLAPATLRAGKPLLPRALGVDRLRLESATRNGAFAELVYSVAKP